MRQGDFSIEVVPHGGGRVRELESGHVLARPRQQYCLRIRNHGPLYAVAAIDLDGKRVTSGGLVIAPFRTTELERPIGGVDAGRFTVIAEGDEKVFGEDGGRDNDELGLVVAEFRRELPRGNAPRDFPPILETPRDIPGRPIPDVPSMPPRFPTREPEWNPPGMPTPSRRIMNTVGFKTRAADVSTPPTVADGAVERAAGTGLTGHSEQQFEPISLGPLESEPTTIRLRIVIGTEEAIAEDVARPLAQPAPERPAARP